MEYLVVVVIMAGVTILILRLLGAWMLRINDVINELKKVNQNIETFNSNVIKLSKK